MIPVDGKPGPADVCVIELGGTIGTLTTVYLTCGSTSFFSVFQGL
jgi:CTP synthase